jgi:hypothetical protein
MQPANTALNAVASIPTTEQRRLATAVSKAQILEAVRGLSDCPRCGFVAQVLAAFCPDLSAALDANSHPALLPGDSAAAPLSRSRSAPTSSSERHVSSGVLAPSQLLSLLSSSSGPEALVSLLQFAWRRQDTPTGAAEHASGRAAAASDGTLCLSEGLLGKPRLLRRFLEESLELMEVRWER